MLGAAAVAGVCTFLFGASAADGSAPTLAPAPVAEFETTVVGERNGDQSKAGKKLIAVPKQRASGEIDRHTLEDRQARSAPEALRYESGISVQQTAHSQGSAFIRGLTGQQTLLMFDGIRLNNSTYRQGPNQYFFTVDQQTIDRLEVLRGGGSTRYGADALGGVVLVHPSEPHVGRRQLSPDAQRRARGTRAGRNVLTGRPRLVLLGATADRSFGGRLQGELEWGPELGFVGGLGLRRVGKLRAAGAVRNPSDDQLPEVPQFGDDGRTQLGTGFNELTFDARAAWRAHKAHTLTVAAYGYQQYDAPRTDKCPPPGARFDECLTFEEQFRHLVYARADSAWEWAGLERSQITFAWQQQHERRKADRPASFVSNRGRDRVQTVSGTFRGQTRSFAPLSWLRLRGQYGLEHYHDWVQSQAWISFTDTEPATTQQRTRGQYLDGSTYHYGGLFAELHGRLWGVLQLRTGGRVAWSVANAPADDTTGSAAIDRTWTPVVGYGSVSYAPFGWLELLGSVDESFRAPNLDDLTSRQQTGPGFQFENPNLKAERATTYETGLRLHWKGLRAELWGFRTELRSAVGKVTREASECPPSTPDCTASASRLQLVNADGKSIIWGTESVLDYRGKSGFYVRNTVTWTWGEGPNLADRPADPSVPFQERVPLSRIPPLNGTAELGYTYKGRYGMGVAVRWATKQDRLALADVADARIPQGGTPGYAVVDVRGSYRHNKYIRLNVVFENLVDTAYRVHGSSINGPERGLIITAEFAPWLPP